MWYNYPIRILVPVCTAVPPVTSVIHHSHTLALCIRVWRIPGLTDDTLDRDFTRLPVQVGATDIRRGSEINWLILSLFPSRTPSASLSQIYSFPHLLEPFLFTLYMSDCRSQSSKYPLIKFADDTALIGFISKDDDSAFLS